jgi:hypothetical protein
MSENYTPKLESLKVSIDKAKTDRIKAQTTKESLEKQQEGIVGEIRAQGVEPDQLDQVILELRTGIDEDFLRLDDLIPAEYKVG